MVEYYVISVKSKFWILGSIQKIQFVIEQIGEHNILDYENVLSFFSFTM